MTKKIDTSHCNIVFKVEEALTLLKKLYEGPIKPLVTSHWEISNELLTFNIIEDI